MIGQGPTSRLVIALVGLLATAATASAQTVTGTVFRDYDADGQRDLAPHVEPGEPGVLVAAFGPTGIVAAGTTDAAGGYSLAVPGGTEVRIEVSGLAPFLAPGPAGPGSATTVTFVTSPAAGVDVGVVNPGQHCQDDPLVAVPCYVNGDPLAGGSSGTGDTLVGFPYEASGQGQNLHLARASEIGATWGLAWSPTREVLFAAAVMKRHVGFGDADLDGLGDTGGIYRIDLSDPANPVAAPLLDFDTDLGIETGDDLLFPPDGDPHSGLPANAGLPGCDPDSWDPPGKISFGDIELSEDERTLWVVNLADRTLYGVDVDSRTLVAGFPLEPELRRLYGACPQGEHRPWGLAIRDGVIYVGSVCSGENATDPLDPSYPDDNPTASDNLHAFIALVDPITGTVTPGFDFPLDRASYPKQTNNTCTSAPPGWRPWLPAEPPHNNSCGSTFARYSYPQPVLADLEVESDGSLILGFLDRLGNQGGEKTRRTDECTGSFAPEYATAGGDIVKVCRVGGGFVLEGDPSGLCPQPPGGAGNGNGPNGGEFYFQDFGVSNHPDNIQGGLAWLPGSGETAATVGDPINLTSGGVLWLDDTAGTKRKAYQVYHGALGGSGAFGKSAGLGDLELLCEPAPQEVGNRVWHDLDGNGVQDPGEPGLAGIAVELSCAGPDGVPATADDTAATAVTDSDGTYLHRTRDPAAALVPGQPCELRVDPSTLGGLVATVRDYGGNTSTTDLSDSDGDAGIVPGRVVIAFTAPARGQNDHSLDFGFTEESQLPGCLDARFAVLCEAAGSGEFAAVLHLTNRSSAPIGHVIVLDPPPGVVFAPGSFDLSASPLPPGATRQIPGVQISGGPSPGWIMVHLGAFDGQLVSCCTEPVTVDFPACGCDDCPAAGSCVPGPGRVCLQGGRFRVEASYNRGTGAPLTAAAEPLSDAAGYFWFSRPSNPEIAVKVLDGRAVNGHWWVFYGGLTDAGFTLSVVDTATGAERLYGSPAAGFGAGGDTLAFRDQP